MIFPRTFGICLLVGGLLTQAAFAEPVDRVSIGVSTALTGDAATYGVDLKNVIIFANEKIAHNRYKLIFEDDKCDGRSAAAVAHRFVDVLKLKYITGYVCSGAALPAAKVFDQSKVLLVAAGVSATSLSDAGPFIFRTWPSDSAAAKILHQYISSRHQHLGVLSEATEYSQGFLASFVSSERDSKLRVDSESYLPATKDFKPLLLKFKAKGVTALFLNSQTESAMSLMVEQMQEIRWKVPLYNAFLGGSKVFLERVGKLAEGLVFVDLPSISALNPVGQELFKEFEAKFGPMHSVNVTFYTGFEAFRALDLAIRSGVAPEKFLLEQSFDGLINKWWFDKNGDIQGLEPVLKTIQNGTVATIQIYQPPTAARLD